MIARGAGEHERSAALRHRTRHGLGQLIQGHRVLVVGRARAMGHQVPDRRDGAVMDLFEGSVFEQAEGEQRLGATISWWLGNGICDTPSARRYADANRNCGARRAVSIRSSPSSRMLHARSPRTPSATSVNPATVVSRPRRWSSRADGVIYATRLTSAAASGAKPASSAPVIGAELPFSCRPAPHPQGPRPQRALASHSRRSDPA